MVQYSSPLVEGIQSVSSGGLGERQSAFIQSDESSAIHIRWIIVVNIINTWAFLALKMISISKLSKGSNVPKPSLGCTSKH